MKLHHWADRFELWQGAAADAPQNIRAGSVQSIVTSPPYWGLRDYGHEGQLGQEETVEEYVAALVQIFAGLREVLADDGVAWLNLGDTYAGRANAGPKYTGNHGAFGKPGHIPGRKRTTSAAPYKSLVGVPWRVALALMEDGWIVRSEVIWHKTNAMPESVKDRPTRAHEHLFMLAKRQRYYYDEAAVREPAVEPGRYVKPYTEDAKASLKGDTSTGLARTHPRGGILVGDTRNRRDVWSIGASAFPGAHFATYPPQLVEPCILSTSRPGDLVLDPFSGSGTTGMVALQHGRRYVGIDLNTEYLDLSLSTRLEPWR